MAKKKTNVNQQTDLPAKTTDVTSVLWASADVLRGFMDANEYKNYILGFLFYKYLSDKFLIDIFNLNEDHGRKPEFMEEALKVYCENSKDESFISYLKDEFAYFLLPEQTYTAIVAFANKDDDNAVYELVKDKYSNDPALRVVLQSALTKLEESFKYNNTNNGDKERTKYDSLFADVDLDKIRGNSTESQKASKIKELLLTINKIDVLEIYGTKDDIIGDAYEYLLGEFASETGKKAGEFYTPRAVSQILSRIAFMDHENNKELMVYDPTMGSGSLLLQAKHLVDEDTVVRYYGQELSTTTYHMAIMNMLLHNVTDGYFKFNNGDTLLDDWPKERDTMFDMVLMNPPYSAKWNPDEVNANDPRFAAYGLAPKGKADYAFLLHGLSHLKDDGTMAIVLPHGVLFRGNAEGRIRKALLEHGRIYAVIGLPEKLFYNTSIPTTIIILKGERKLKDGQDARDVLFIDASNEFEKGKKQNKLTDENINTILELYKNRVNVDKKAHLATFEEIESNDFNLNIPRYVDTFENDPEIVLSELSQQLAKEIKMLNEELRAFTDDLDQLTSEDKKIEEDNKANAELLRSLITNNDEILNKFISKINQSDDNDK